MEGRKEGPCNERLIEVAGDKSGSSRTPAAPKGNWKIFGRNGTLTFNCCVNESIVKGRERDVATANQ